MTSIPPQGSLEKLFYGWWNVAASFVGLSLSYAMFTVFALGIFIAPLEAEFGWSRAEISWANTITNITIVVCSPLVGALVDRVGVRRVLVPSIAMMGVVVASMYWLSANILHFYAIFLLIPLLGAGTLPLSYSRIVVAWFARRRGLALGISLAGFGVGAALIPPVGQWLIDSFGWREAYLAFAAAVFLVNLPLAAFLLREKPEDMGLAPDGEPPLQDDEVAVDPHTGLSGIEAARTRSYWFVFASFLLVGFAVTGILIHLVPMLIGRGVTPKAASFFMGSLGLGLVVGRILAGFLMDRYFAPYVTALFLSLMLFGILILASGTDSALVLIAPLLVGLALGSEISEIAYIVSRYFGPRSFGQVYGAMFSAFQVGSAFGAPALGLYYDRVGNYIGALWGIAVVVLVGIVLILQLGPYPDLRRERPA